MKIFKKNENKETVKLPMSGKVKNCYIRQSQNYPKYNGAGCYCTFSVR